MITYVARYLSLRYASRADPLQPYPCRDMLRTVGENKDSGSGTHPLIEFSSFLIKLEYHVNLCCLHLYRENQINNCNTLIAQYPKAPRELI